MKKHVKLLFNIVLIISLLLPVSVFAVSNMKLTNKTYVNTGSGSNIVAKFKTNKGYAYCVTPGKTGPSVGNSLSYKSTVKKGGLVYILDNAGTSDSSYMVTQLAVWKYNNGFNKAASSSNNAKANAIVKAAKNHSNYDTTPSVSISASDSAKNLSEGTNYYKSGKITIKYSNIKSGLKVELVNAPKNSKIVDGNGKTKTSFKNGDSFYVYVPTTSLTSKKSFNVKISGVGYLTRVERYKSSNSKLQELVVLIKEKKTVSEKITLTGTPVVRKCQYHNGKYYDKDGNVTDKTTYSIQCEKHSCEKVGDKYFGKSGNIVDKTQFQIECGTNICTKVGDKYFGKNGKEVDEITYDKECNKHVCEKVGDSYFGKNGYEVDYKTYDKECKKHVCEQIDDTYFGPNGTEVSFDEFDLKCNAHVCEQVGDKYFDRNGNESTYEEYTLQCEKHACEIIGDKFVGSNGKEVDEATYKAQCEAPEEVVIVPNTADISGLVYLLIGTLMIGGTVVVLNTISNRKVNQ